MNTTEIWKDIEGYEGFYQVSNYGRVRSLDRDVYYLVKGKYKTKRTFYGQIIQCWVNNSGYVIADLTKNNTRKHHLVHVLVAKAFTPNPKNKPCVGHWDCDKTNNRVENLYWCTPIENMENEITLERMRESGRKRDVSYLFTKENLEKRRLALIGHITREETKSKISKSRSIPIVRLTLNNDLIEEFKNSLEAAEKTNFAQAMINRACHGKYFRKSRNKWYDNHHIYKNNKWMFKSDYEEMLAGLPN